MLIIWLRIEAFAVLIAAFASYQHAHYSWIVFAILFLVTDVSFAGYLRGPRFGAICYNVVHCYAVPLVLAGILFSAGMRVAIPLIWIAHIAMDRALGYGLKYSTGFGDTHLGKLGKPVG